MRREVLVPTPAVRNLIREGKTHQIYSALQTGGQFGMQTMDTSLAELVREHKITPRAGRVALERARGAAAPAWAPCGRRSAMATFAFKALDLAGAPTKGEMEAGDKQAVAAQLRSKGLIVVDIEEQKPASAGDILARFQRVKADELVIATRQLSTMVSSGMSLLRALYVIEEQTENDKLREVFDRGPQGRRGRPRALRRAASGTPTSSTSSTWRWCAPARPAESSTDTLVRVADQLEKDAALRRQVKAAMIYPALIGGFALIVLFALVAFLVPVFEKIFKDFGGELPAITKFTVWLSHLFTDRWYMLLAVAFARRLAVPLLEELRDAAACSGTA